jgi:predicted dehydrogenase
MYTDFRQLLASDIDAVIIATPVFLHAVHFEAAVQAGKHIYIEKPAAAEVEGCRRIMRTAEGASRKLNITFGFQRRYAPLYQKAKHLIESGAIGSIRMGRADYIRSKSTRPVVKQLVHPSTDIENILAWHSWRDLSGDLIVENNVHSIDVLNWFIGGHPRSAVGRGGGGPSQGGDTRDHNLVAFEYDNGVQGQLLGTTLAPQGYRHVVEQFFGETGLVETSEKHWSHFVGPQLATGEKALRNITNEALAEFVNRIATDRPENTAVRGVESTLTAILGRMAMDSRREVTWGEMLTSI